MSLGSFYLTLRKLRLRLASAQKPHFRPPHFPLYCSLTEAPPPEVLQSYLTAFLHGCTHTSVSLFSAVFLTLAETASQHRGGTVHSLDLTASALSFLSNTWFPTQIPHRQQKDL